MVALTIRISWRCDIFYRTRVVLACPWNTTIFNSTYLQANVNYKKRNIVEISGISTIILCALFFPFRLPLCSCSLTLSLPLLSSLFCWNMHPARRITSVALYRWIAYWRLWNISCLAIFIIYMHKIFAMLSSSIT